MKYHLDTTFLIHWRKADSRVAELRNEIVSGMHDVSIDPIVQTEFFAATRIDRSYQIVFQSILNIGQLLPISHDAAMLAASWIGNMDLPQRRARFADALISAVALERGATLVTADGGIQALFPVSVLRY